MKNSKQYSVQTDIKQYYIVTPLQLYKNRKYNNNNNNNKYENTLKLHLTIILNIL